MEETPFLSIDDLARRYAGLSVATLRHWRMQGFGPPSYRVGRRLYYRLAEVEQWEATWPPGVPTSFGADASDVDF